MDLLERAKQKLSEQKTEVIGDEQPSTTKTTITEKKPKIAKKPKKVKEKDLLPEINKSLELNLIKSIYANRFGSTTNKVKKEMLKDIISEWKKEI
ncbi:MAG: hypothetical protein ACFFDF_17080 [Candidatus Odinarchaeota archaeon]